MNMNRKRYLLTWLLIIGLNTITFGQGYSDTVPDGYSMAPPYSESTLFRESNQLPSVDADSSWVDETRSSYGNQTYRVRKGDTLGSISKKIFGSTKFWKKIAKANNIADASKISIGQVLTIPEDDYPSRGIIYRQRTRQVSSPPQIQTAPVVKTAPAPSLPLPPVTTNDDAVLYSSGGLPQIVLPGMGEKKKVKSKHQVGFDGLTGLFHTFAAYPLGENLFSTAFGVVWNKITKRESRRLKNGEDGDYWQFPIIMTYSGENFEVAFKLPFESYDVFAPITYNFRDGTDSGMGDGSLRLKFSSQNDKMASCLGVGAIFPTSDISIGNTSDNNAWEVFAGLSSKNKEGGNFHLNGGYQAGDGNTTHEGVFVNTGFEYDPNESFTFIGELNFYNRINSGRSTDLTLGFRYHVKEGMSISVDAPIALSNDMFFGYDYRLESMLQYNY